jgi:hypothetical protein
MIRPSRIDRRLNYKVLLVFIAPNINLTVIFFKLVHSHWLVFA